MWWVDVVDVVGLVVVGVCVLCMWRREVVIVVLFVGGGEEMVVIGVVSRGRMWWC